ncbi:MAG: DUF5606 domain-containing protein [Bacteroidia bacterium]|nr:DUF5606 domain-containing protein [Bacteroidia bacterium]
MTLSIKDVVALTGAPGLYRIVKTDDKSIVVESLDDRKKRQLVKGNMMVSKLTDVSIYTDGEAEPLVNVLKKIQETFGSALPVTKDSDKDELLDFLASMLPTFDRERVYASNVKKLLSWYQVLLDFEVDLTWDPEAESGEQTEAPENEASAPEEVA